MNKFYLNIAIMLAMALVVALPVQAEKFQLTNATIKDVNAAYDAGELNAETLVKLFLARINAYDNDGPHLNAVITLNPQALEQAKALDIERKRSGPRSPLHGIPIVLKDNLDTADTPTTAGSFMLKGSIPPDDAFVVEKLRKAGAIILAKANMNEFANGGPMSSLGGIIRNPHNPARSPGGSSSGTGAAIAAAYAMVGLGTDTGGSVRIPSSFNGIVGLKTTHGLVSRDGVIPLALSLDTVGPMTRSVYDAAVMLGAMTGIDRADPSTRKSKGHFHKDYTRYLDKSALKKARIGVARDFMSSQPEVKWVIEAALENMKQAGATLVDVQFPKWFIDTHHAWQQTLIIKEFSLQIPDYLATLDEPYPKTFSDLIKRSMMLTAPDADGMIPNPGRWARMKEVEGNPAEDYEYNIVKGYGIPLAQRIVEGLMDTQNLDAIVYPTRTNTARLLDADPIPVGGKYVYALHIANLTGFPELVVPAGFTGMGMPVTISFLGKAFSEPELLALGYAFESRTRAIRLPVTTPPLAGENPHGSLQ